MKTITSFAVLLPFISSALAAPITCNITNSQSPPTPVHCATYDASADGVHCVTTSYDGTTKTNKFTPYDDANLTARSDPSSKSIPGSGPGSGLNPNSNSVPGSGPGSGLNPGSNAIPAPLSVLWSRSSGPNSDGSDHNSYSGPTGPKPGPDVSVPSVRPYRVTGSDPGGSDPSNTGSNSGPNTGPEPGSDGPAPHHGSDSGSDSGSGSGRRPRSYGSSSGSSSGAGSGSGSGSGAGSGSGFDSGPKPVSDVPAPGHGSGSGSGAGYGSGSGSIPGYVPGSDVV